MKTNLSTLAIAAAAVLGFSASANATHNDAHRNLNGNGDRDTRASEMQRDDRSFLSRMFSWPSRAGRTVVHSPTIARETFSGKRDIISDHGRPFAQREDVRSRDRLTLRERSGRLARNAGETVEHGAVSTGNFAVRSGRTIVHTPQIIGESLTGRRHIISRDGRFFSARNSEGRNENPAAVTQNGRGERLYATTY